MEANHTQRGVAQLVEYRSPKPMVAGSSPVAPAKHKHYDQESFWALFAIVNPMINVKAVPVRGYLPHIIPDFDAIGTELDNAIKKDYLGKRIAIRAISTDDHDDESQSDLIELIKTLGTDRYDKNRSGDRYENIEKKHIDIFALPVDPVMEESGMFGHMLKSFYEYPLRARGAPVYVDIIIVYDLDKLEAVQHKYEGRDEIKKDGFVFKDADHKPESVLGIYTVVNLQ